MPCKNRSRTLKCDPLNGNLRYVAFERDVDLLRLIRTENLEIAWPELSPLMAPCTLAGAQE